MRTRSRKQRGFTLIEALVAAVLLTGVVAAVAQAISAGEAETYYSLINLRGTALAEAMMEEILSKPYADPQGTTTVGPDAGETSRSLYDNIDDYHGFSEAAGALADASGTTYPTDFQKFTRSVTVVAGSNTPTGLSSTAITGVTITVTVSQSNGGDSWTISRFVPDPSQ